MALLSDGAKVSPFNPVKSIPDPTIRNVRRIADNKGYDGWILMNLHPQRTPHPEEMREDDVWSENNPKAVEAVVRQFQIHAIWCAWGNMIDMPGKAFLYRALARIYEVIGYAAEWYSYGNLTKAGNPRHPLYMPLTHDFHEFDVCGYLKKKGI